MLILITCCIKIKQEVFALYGRQMKTQREVNGLFELTESARKAIGQQILQ